MSFKSVRLLNDYVVVYKPTHPSSMKNKNWDGYVYEHTYVTERHLGRQLTDFEIVHHLDGNRQNNLLSNLLVLTKSDHSKLHAWILKGAPGLETLRMNGMNLLNSSFYNGETPRKIIRCEHCNDIIQVGTNIKFCSADCLEKENAITRKRPEKEILIIELKELRSFSAVARKYSVSPTAVCKWCKLYDIVPFKKKTIISQAADKSAEGSETSGEVLNGKSS